MAHHFYESRKVETGHFRRADIFYKKQLHALKIERCDYNTPKGKTFQQKDIDLWLILENGRISVSEKKRTRDYNDLYLELYSKYPQAPGWAIHSQAGFLAYFFPERVLWAGFPQIKRFLKESLLPQINPDEWKKLQKTHPENNFHKPAEYKVCGITYSVTLIQAYNETRNNTWYTMGISIPFDMLRDNHIRYRMYPLPPGE